MVAQVIVNVNVFGESAGQGNFPQDIINSTDIVNIVKKYSPISVQQPFYYLNFKVCTHA